MKLDLGEPVDYDLSSLWTSLGVSLGASLWDNLRASLKDDL